MQPTIRVAGHDLPTLGFGTMRNDGDAGVALVEAALAEGYRHLDTAEAYGNEEAVGRGLARSAVARDDVWVTTKLLHPRNGTPDDIVATAEAGLRRLGLDHVDALLVHWPHPEIPMEEALDALVELRGAGKARTIGVCNLPASALVTACEQVPDLAIEQVEYHPYLAQDAVLEVVRRHGMALTAHCPFARGRVADDPVLAEIADGHGATPAQVTLAWLLHQDRVTAIPGTSDLHHLRANLAATELRLSDDEVARIHTLADGTRLVDPPHAPTWDV